MGKNIPTYREFRKYWFKRIGINKYVNREGIAQYTNEEIIAKYNYFYPKP